jgi:hypothetical protein
LRDLRTLAKNAEFQNGVEVFTVQVDDGQIVVLANLPAFEDAQVKGQLAIYKTLKSFFFGQVLAIAK